MQELLGVEEPDYGHLFEDMRHEEAEPVDLGAYLQPRVEPEIGFILGRDLAGPGVTRVDAAEAVEWVVPALEIVDSRIADWRITLVDTIADNASSGGYVLGAARARLADLDLPAVGCVLTVDGAPVGRGAGADVMGDPLEALAWLANTLGARGRTLRAGDVVLPGALCAMVPARVGEVVRADFTGLGSVTARFIGGMT
jgi:2-keto-4-pentenoate hydratase